MVFELCFLNLNMVLFVHLKQASIKKQTKVNSVLAKPDVSLSQVMPMSSIEVANAAVHYAMMKALELKKNEEMNCNEEVIHQGNHQARTAGGRVCLVS